jgi:uncharacterized protein YndB with AHSA1/START domain
MSHNAEFSHANMVRFDRPLPGNAPAIWAVLTDIARLANWYGVGAIEPRAGGKVELMDGHIRGVVTQWQPPHRLAYTWNVFMPGQSVSDFPESYLKLEIGDGSVTLTHLPVLDEYVKLNAVGWHTFLDMVEAELKGEPRQSRDALMARNAGIYGVALPAR